MRKRQPNGFRLPPPPEGIWLAAAATGLIYLAHYMAGARLLEAALSMALPLPLLVALGAGLVLAAILVHPGLREDLISRRDLNLPAALFAGVLLTGAWMLTPWIPGGPHPIWTYVGEPPAGTVDRSATLGELVKLGGLGCIFLIGMASGAADRRARTALGLMILVGVAFALWAGVIRATGLEPDARHLPLDEAFRNTGVAGALFSVLALLALGFVLRHGDGTTGGRFARLAPPAGAAALFSTVLLLTASRGGILVALGAIILLLALMMFAGRMRPGLAGMAILALAAAMLTIGSPALDGVLGLDRNAPVNAGLIAGHWGAFLASPLCGYGLGTAAVVNETLLTASTPGAPGATGGIGNVYLTWLEQAGLVGAIPMFLCIGAIMWRTLQGALKRSRMTSVLFGLLAADAVFLLRGMTDDALETYSMACMFAWLLGVQMALCRGARG